MKIAKTIVIISLLFMSITPIRGTANIKKESQKILNSKVFWATVGVVLGSVGTSMGWLWKISHNQVKQCLSAVKAFEDLLKPDLDNHVYGYEIKAHIANKPSIIISGKQNVTDSWKEWVKLNRNGDCIWVTVWYKYNKKWQLDTDMAKTRTKIVHLWQSYQEQFNVQWTSFLVNNKGEETPMPQ